MIGNLTRLGAGKGLALHLLNYAPRAVSCLKVRVHLDREFASLASASLRAESPDALPRSLRSRRTGPDLARVGGRYSDDWHRAHLMDPRSVVPESVMPSYPWLFENTLDGNDTAAKMRALRLVGVPYTDEDIAGAGNAVAGQKEADAVVAYLQQLGTLLKSTR